MSVSNLSSAFPTNSYSNQLYRSIDRNYDNIYSRQEVSNFTAAYEKSTGKAVDVDSLFEAYDVDLDGAFSYEEYKSVIADDALGMALLHGVKGGEEAQTDTFTAVDEAESAQEEFSSWYASLGGREKNALIQSKFMAESTGNLINAIFGSSNLFSGLNQSYALSQYNNSRMLNFQYMNSMAPSVNLLF